MITAVLFVPAAPWLIPSVAPSLLAEQTDLRQAIGVLVDGIPAARWMALGVGGARSRARWDAEVPPDLGPDPYRGGSGSEGGLPGSYWVARALLGPVALGAGLLPPGEQGSDEPNPVHVALAASASEGHPSSLVVTADGSTAHGEHAPGAPDARAADYDAALHAALAGGPAASRAWLASVDGSPELAAELGATLPVALSAVLDALAVAGASETGWDVVAEDLVAPYGVGHHVVRWSRR